MLSSVALCAEWQSTADLEGEKFDVKSNLHQYKKFRLDATTLIDDRNFFFFFAAAEVEAPKIKLATY